MLCACFGKATAQQASSSINRLIENHETAVEGRKYNLAGKIGTQLENLGKAVGDSNAYTLGLSYRIDAYLSTHDTLNYDGEVEKLKRIYERMKTEGDRRVAGTAARILGKYYHFIYNAYSTSLQYYHDALSAHRAEKQKLEEIRDLSAMAVLYLHKQDSAGWDYALKAYNLSKEAGHEPSVYISACNIGNYLCNLGKFDQAIEYIDEASSIADHLHYDMEHTYLNTFKGTVNELRGRTEDAERFYRKSLDIGGGTTIYDIIYSRIKYGSFLHRQKRYREALALLRDIENTAQQYHMFTFQAQLYPLIAECEESLGDYRAALDYQRKFMDVNNRIFSEEKEREFAILDLRYKVSEEKRINSAQGLELMRKKRITELTAILAFVILAFAIVLFLYHKKRMSAYKSIVRSHLENAENERLIKEKYEKLIEELSDTPKKTCSLNDDRISEFFNRLESLMSDDRIYRQCDLSLDKVAAMLGTNRTYLSQVVNERVGSFSTYVNQFRLKEAIELLSDPENNDSLKTIGLSVGFTSPSNFYSLFRQKVGMSPSMFRENVRNISSESRQ